MTVSANFCYSLFIFLFLFCPVVFAVLYKKEKLNKVLALILLGLYIVALIIGVFTKASIKNGVFSIRLDYSAGWANKTIKFNILKTRKVDFLINSVLLFPIGVILSLFLSYKNKPIKKQLISLLVVGFVIGLFIEFMQFLLPIARSVQLSDLLLNTISSVMGGLYFVFVNSITKKLRKKALSE